MNENTMNNAVTMAGEGNRPREGEGERPRAREGERPREPLSMNNAVTMRPDAGASLGRIDQYELIRELGGGGFGCVYLARDTVAGIDVAVKGLPPLVRLNKEELENVRKNFALVSRLHHPNIAAALTLHPVTNAFYNDKTDAEKLRVFSGDTLVVMQYAPGVTLSQWRKQFPDGKVPLDKALEITRQIASALDYAHKERIIHRDIKPANVMIETLPDRSVTARVLDFGLAAEIRSSMSRVSQSITDTSGTRPYMAPEQWLGEKQGFETDQYSLAVLFYELITSEVPFASVFDTGDPVLMMNVVGNRAFNPSSDLPKPIRFALTKALSKKREDRFESCLAFVDALQRGCMSGGRASPLGGRASPRAAAILTAVAALGLAVGGILYWHQGSSDVNMGMAREYARPPENIVPAGRASVPASREDKEYTGPRHGDRKTLTLPGGATMTMIYVAPGSFMMGSPSSEEGRDDNETQHHVTLTKGYWLGETEVTQAQWESVMGNNPSYFKGASRPVEQVSWKDCQEFIAKVNREARRQFGGDARLPTEAEWEYACRAGTQTAYSWGNSLNGDKANCDGNYPYGTTIKGTYKQETVNVCSYSPNAWGFYDMHGNVWEWCQDWYGRYPSGAETDPTGSASGDNRVLRGGGWSDFARFCRSARRIRFGAGDRNSFFGFRLACSVGPREDSEVNDVVEPQKTEQDDIKRVQLWEGGPYWADRNIGAEKPEDSGYYFWWGDTVGYKREGDKWVASDESMLNFSFIYNTMIKTYDKSISDMEREGWIENKNGTYVLTSKHDAAQAHLGGAWRMPTIDEFGDLLSKCDWTWTMRNGKNGYVVRGRGNYASKSIFLPAAGRGDGASLDDSGSSGYSSGYYWSSVPLPPSCYALGLNFASRGYKTCGIDCGYGQSVRPVQGFTK